MNIYITSTEKKSGKTVISAGIAAVMQSLGYNTGVYKPIETGAIDKGKYLLSADLNFVKMLDPYITTHATYMIKSQINPLTGAQLENIIIDRDEIIRDYTLLTHKTETLIVEAPSGLMTPLKDNFFAKDIPLILDIPVLFVITPGENNVNHYLNELNTAKTNGLDIIGVIINKFSVYSDNPDVKQFPNLIEKYSDAKILGLIRNFKGNSVNTNVLFNEMINGIDFEDVFRMKIPKLNKY